MAHYLVQLSYTPEAWGRLLKSPSNRLEAVKPALNKVGARIDAGYFSFGDYDLIAILVAPDNVTAAALSLAFAAGGAVKAIKTTPLMTMEDGMAAMRQAAEIAKVYQPPAS
jgi:uncharacterized protein with GYD domain